GIAQALFSDKEGIVQKQLARAIGESLKVEKALAEFRASRLEDDKTDFGLQKEINAAKEKGLDIIGVAESKDVKRIKDRASAYKEEQKQISIINDIARTLGLTFDKFVKQDKVKKEIDFEPKFLMKDLSKSLLKVLLLDEISLDVRGIKFRTIPKTDMDRMREQLEKGISSKPAQVSVDIKLNQEKLNAAKQQFEAFSADINNSFKAIGVDSLANIGDVIGQALTGGDIGKAFQGFAEIVGSGLQQIGKQLIQVGLLAKLSQKALSQLFFNPGLAIATGIALSAAGAALKNAFKGGIKGFAQGGLVFGPTVGMVGEGFNTRRSNPEVIAPLDKLKSIIGEGGGGAVRVVVTGRLRGIDMALMNARTSRKNGRLGG
ncbi:MAG: hypothetical protein JNK14_05685, partial [Chitinophagaceae bacterium]|nr:hypothetical protein [Chitinophagaceae bacterium]